MSDKPRDLTLERVNRLTVAVADIMEAHNAQARVTNAILDLMDKKLDRLDESLQTLTKEMRGLASEQVLLGNRVENAFSQALRTNIRLDEIEDANQISDL